jgi:tRNA(fMet)-specific endonuclease VapC
MASQYLLDSNTASFVIKGNIPAVRRKLVRVQLAQLFVASVTEAELRDGAAQLSEATKLQRLIEEFLLSYRSTLGFKRCHTVRPFAS